MAFCHPDGQTSSPSLAPTAGYHPCPRLHSLWVLFRHNETLCSLYATRGNYLPSLRAADLIPLCPQTGWGTRAGIGDAGAATAALADADNARLQEKVTADNNTYDRGYNNNPYQQPQAYPQPQPQQSYPYQAQDSPFRDEHELSPFRDDTPSAGQIPPGPYRDSSDEGGGTPVYAARSQSQKGQGGRRGDYDGGMGYAT
jgi:hypothetical protein